MPDFSVEERVTLAQMVTGLLASWRVAPADQIRLLALPGSTRAREIQHYRKDRPLPDEPAVIERVEHLFGIADALRTTFPMNQEMGGIWMNRSNRRFQDRTPLRKMLEEGLPGILEVRTHLDCAYGWRLDDERARKEQP